MPENIRVSKKTVAYLLVGVLAAAFLGIVAGSYFAKARITEALRPGKNLLLKVGQPFPVYKFAALSTEQADLYQSLEGKKSVVIFLTTDCDYCVKVMARWDSVYRNVSHKYQVVGISYEPLEKLKDYQKEIQLTFPLYNDLQEKFTGKYKIDTYPTILGINEKREIVFIDFGNRPKKPVKDYLKLL